MEYLRKQLGKSMKQKIHNLESPSGSNPNPEDLSEAESHQSVNEEEEP